MKPIDYIIIGVVVIAVTLVVAHLVKRKKQGKSGCGCGCSSCPSAGACPSAKAYENREEKKDD